MSPGTLDVPAIRQSVPTAMQGAPRWVCWRYIEEDVKTHKVPYRADGLEKSFSLPVELCSTVDPYEVLT